MSFNLAGAFRAFVAGLHGAVDPEAVETLAQHFEHIEAQLADAAEKLTGDAAHWVEKYTGPAPAEVPAPAAEAPAAEAPAATFSDAQPSA